MNDQKKKEEPAVIAMIAGLEKGQTAVELEAAIREAVTASMLTKKSATVTLSISIAAGDDDSVRVTPDIAKKLPKLPRKSQTFFVHEDGALSRSSERDFPEVKRAEAEAEEKAQQTRPGFRVMKPDGSIIPAVAATA